MKIYTFLAKKLKFFLQNFQNNDKYWSLKNLEISKNLDLEKISTFPEKSRDEIRDENLDLESRKSRKNLDEISSRPISNFNA